MAETRVQGRVWSEQAAAHAYADRFWLGRDLYSQVKEAEADYELSNSKWVFKLIWKGDLFIDNNN